MRKVIIALVIVSLLLVVGCVPVSSPSTDGTVPPLPGEPSSVVTNPPLVGGATFVVAPAYLELGGLFPGAEISTWTEKGYLDLAGSKVPYDKGDPVCIAIYNGQDYAVSYMIAIEDAPLEINQCNTLGKEYHMAPSGFILVVAISDSLVTLSPYEIRTIPFAFVLPSGLDYPEAWEFRIIIAEQGVQVGRAYGVRIFVTMG